MAWKSFALGAGIGLAVAIAWIVAAPAARTAAARVAGAPAQVKVAPDQTITFSDKIFSDSGDDSAPFGVGYVLISGSLLGDDQTSNNTTTLACTRSENRCEIATATQIGEQQVDEITITDYAISSWTPALIVATDEAECASTTLNIDRRAKTATYVIVPANLTRPICDKAPKTVRRVSVERSAFWRRNATAGEKAPAR
jgi:hypothetical protein